MRPSEQIEEWKRNHPKVYQKYKEEYDVLLAYAKNRELEKK